MSCMSLETLLYELNHADPDVCADYGEDYGTEWGFSRDKLNEIIEKARKTPRSLTNEGYTIRSMTRTSRKAAREEGVALACQGTNAWVTWGYTRQADGTPDFFWGHYFSGEREAKADFYRRLAEEFSC